MHIVERGEGCFEHGLAESGAPAYLPGANAIGIAEPVLWLWPDWLPRSELTLFAGTAGTGKGLLLARIMAAVSGHGELPDRGVLGSEPGTVALVSFEDRRQQVIHPRLWAAGATLNSGGRPIRFFPDYDEPSLDYLSDLALIVVDPVSAMLARAGINENENGAVIGFYDSLARYARSRECALILVQHEAKMSSERSAVDRIRGGGAQVGNARMVWSLIRDGERDDGSLIFARVKTNLPVDVSGGLRFRIRGTTAPGFGGQRVPVGMMEFVSVVEGYGPNLVRDATANRRGGSKSDTEGIQRDIIAALRAGPVTVRQLVQRVGGTDRQHERARKALQNEGDIRIEMLTRETALEMNLPYYARARAVMLTGLALDRAVEASGEADPVDGIGGEEGF